jgi:hypothetical protein
VSEVLVTEHQLSVRHACRAVGLSRTAWYRRPAEPATRDQAVREAVLAVVEQHGRWGFWKCFDRLRLLGHRWNHKHVHRVYCALRLNVPRRAKRRVPTRLRQPLVAPTRLNGIWALDFMHDAQNNNRIQKFANTGTFLLTFGWGVQDGAAVFEACNSSCRAGISGGGNGQFSSPYGVAVDSDGNVYVADPVNGRIEKFTNTGTFLTAWYLDGIPIGVAVDGSGNVFVANTYNYRIQKFTNTGTFLTKWGSAGSGPGQFSAPWGVAVDGSGSVYIADTNNDLMEKFACP